MDMKFIKKNKFTFFIVIFFIILLILLLQVRNLFFPSGGDANYGDRLDGIVEISGDILSKLDSTLKENEAVSNVSTNVQGRILNILITVQDSVLLNDAKALGESTATLLDESTLSNYDVQVFVKKDSTVENDFPIIGYKAKNSEGFSWSKDREKTVEEDSES